MKLLFDQNLSRLLVGRFAEEFPDSVHVTDVGLDRATDREVWEFARAGGYVIVSKDSDFRQLAFLFGPPPKVVWLRVGNASTTTSCRCCARASTSSKSSPTAAKTRSWCFRACSRAGELRRCCEVRHSDLSVVYRREPQ